MIKVENVYFYYSKNKILEEVNLTLNPGHIYGLVGPNGSGKSTLLKVISNQLGTNKGSVMYHDELIDQSYSFKQECILLNEDYYKGEYTIETMAKKYAQMKNREVCFKTIMELAQLLNINPKAKIRTFSKGNSQSALLIAILSIKPRIILLDEFFDGIDIVNRKYLKDYLINYVLDYDVILVVSSHSSDDINDICNQLILLKDGTIKIAHDLDEYKASFVTYQIVSIHSLDDDYFEDYNVKGFKKLNNIYWLRMDYNEEIHEQIINNPDFNDARIIKSSLEEVLYYEFN